MNRETFLKQLEMLLCDISVEERADAMAFYRSYFEDAGEENEASVIEELGSPQKVAESIKKNLGTGAAGQAGYYSAYANRDAEYYKNVNDTINNLQKKEKNNTWAIVLAVIVAIVTSPIWGSLLVALVSIAFSIAAVMFALLVTGVALIGVGIGLIFTGNGIVGMALMGAGFLVLALGVLVLVAVVWIFGGFLPWAVKGIIGLFRKGFGKGKERAL